MNNDVIQSLRTHLREALPMSQALDYSRGWDRKRYDKVFNGKYRLYIPLDHLKNINLADMDEDEEIPYPILRVFYDAGYHLDYEDYVDGIYKDKHGRDAKIGRFLQKQDPTGELLNIFNQDPQRAGKNLDGKDLMVVISRHPYDIAGMSTNRGWVSCMELPNERNKDGGCNHHYVRHDIELGTIAAYLARKKDTNLQSPLGRVLIKPFFSPDHKHFILNLSDRHYGAMSKEVMDVIRDWLHKNQDKLSNAAKNPLQLYSFDENLYQDEDPDRIVYRSKAVKALQDLLNTDEVEKFSRWAPAKNLNLASEVPTTMNDDGDPMPLLDSVVKAKAWKIFDLLLQRPYPEPLIATQISSKYPQAVLDKLVSTAGVLDSHLPIGILRPDNRLFLTILRLRPHDSQLPAILFYIIKSYCNTADPGYFNLIQNMLKAGVSLESKDPLQVGHYKKRIVSNYIFDIVSTKSFPEVITMKITTEQLKQLISVLEAHGGKRHPKEPRVIVRKGW